MMLAAALRASVQWFNITNEIHIKKQCGRERVAGGKGSRPHIDPLRRGLYTPALLCCALFGACVLKII